MPLLYTPRSTIDHEVYLKLNNRSFHFKNRILNLMTNLSSNLLSVISLVPQESEIRKHLHHRRSFNSAAPKVLNCVPTLANEYYRSGNPKSVVNYSEEFPDSANVILEDCIIHQRRETGVGVKLDVSFDPRMIYEDVVTWGFFRSVRSYAESLAKRRRC